MRLGAAVLGIDLGTSAVRVVAVSERRVIEGEQRAALDLGPRPMDSITQEASAWWQATQAAISALKQQVDLRSIRTLAIDGTSGTVLAVDQHGRPLSAARMYNDRASPATVAALARILPENSAAVGATSPLARMIELQQPGTCKLIHQADWLTGQFTGRFDISDENNALKSGFDVLLRRWPGWIGNTQLDPALLPEVVPAGTDLGRVRKDIAAQFDFDPGLRIVAGTTDGCASFIASGADRLGDAVTSLGTTLILKQVCAKPIAAGEFGVYSHRLGGLWLAGGASNSGGGALLQFFSTEQLNSLESSLTPSLDTNLGYYPLPATGERFPYANPTLEPLMNPRPNDDARFLQGLLEGIAAIEKTGYSRLQELGAPPVLRIFTVGGGSRNEAWRQIRERIVGIRIKKGFADAAYGAALIALSSLQQKQLFA